MRRRNEEEPLAVARGEGEPGRGHRARGRGTESDYLPLWKQWALDIAYHSPRTVGGVPEALPAAALSHR